MCISLCFFITKSDEFFFHNFQLGCRGTEVRINGQDQWVITPTNAPLIGEKKHLFTSHLKDLKSTFQRDIKKEVLDSTQRGFNPTSKRLFRQDMTAIFRDKEFTSLAGWPGNETPARWVPGSGPVIHGVKWGPPSSKEWPNIHELTGVKKKPTYRADGAAHLVGIQSYCHSMIGVNN